MWWGNNKVNNYDKLKIAEYTFYSVKIKRKLLSIYIINYGRVQRGVKSIAQ